MALDDHEDSEYGDVFSDQDIDFHHNLFSSDDEDDESISIEDEEVWNLITKMKKDSQVPTPQLKKEPKKLRKTVYKDISIKIGADVYELDRLPLALKSDYFETLFKSDFDHRENEHLEIRTIDSDTFSIVVDIIYGRNLGSVLNMDNFAELLLAMDYLQMEIDLGIFQDCIESNNEVRLSNFRNGCQLINFIGSNSNFAYLLPNIYEYFSIHLIEAFQCEEFFSLYFEQFVKIIKRNKFPKYTEEKRKIARICTEWICVDVENRLQHMADLVNAAKYRYNFDFRVDERSISTIFLLEINDGVKQKKEMERYFNNLLNLNGQIDPGREENDSNNDQADVGPYEYIVNKIDYNKKWTSIKECDLLYDITVKVDQKNYKLHRYQLKSKTDYFTELDEPEDYTEPLKPLNKDDAHQLDGIDRITFEKILQFIYFDNIDFHNVSIINVIKAGELLKIRYLKEICQFHITSNLNTAPITEEFIEILNLSATRKDYKMVWLALLKHIISTWPNVSTMSSFHTISCTTLEHILYQRELEINFVDEILYICSNWIAHDPKKRYQLMPRIATAITRNYSVNYYNFEMEMPADWNNCSQEFIRDKLWNMLGFIWSVISDGNGTNLEKEPESAQQPMFIATMTENKRVFAILDLNFKKIAEIRSPTPAKNDTLSAALIGNNLFILFAKKPTVQFQVYNLSSKKLFSLSPLPPSIDMDLDGNATLLNCNDDLYCCFESGTVLKYSMEINRWMLFYREISSSIVLFAIASNGNSLYRIFKEFSTKQFIMECYNFNQKSWTRLPQLSLQLRNERFSKADQIYLTTANGNIAVLLGSVIALFDQQAKIWRDFRIWIPGFVTESEQFGSFVFTQYRGKILYMQGRQIWNIFPSEKILEISISNFSKLPMVYSNIAAIHFVSKLL